MFSESPVHTPGARATTTSSAGANRPPRPMSPGKTRRSSESPGSPGCRGSFWQSPSRIARGPAQTLSASPGAQARTSVIKKMQDQPAEPLEKVAMVCEEIRRVSKDGRSTTFGILVKDERVRQVFDAHAVVGTLLAAKRKNLVTFEGDLWQRGQRDSVEIALNFYPSTPECDDMNGGATVLVAPLAATGGARSSQCNAERTPLGTPTTSKPERAGISSTPTSWVGWEIRALQAERRLEEAESVIAEFRCKEVGCASSCEKGTGTSCAPASSSVSSKVNETSDEDYFQLTELLREADAACRAQGAVNEQTQALVQQLEEQVRDLSQRLDIASASRSELPRWTTDECGGATVSGTGSNVRDHRDAYLHASSETAAPAAVPEPCELSGPRDSLLQEWCPQEEARVTTLERSLAESRAEVGRLRGELSELQCVMSSPSSQPACTGSLITPGTRLRTRSTHAASNASAPAAAAARAAATAASAASRACAAAASAAARAAAAVEDFNARCDSRNSDADIVPTEAPGGSMNTYSLQLWLDGLKFGWSVRFLDAFASVGLEEATDLEHALDESTFTALTVALQKAGAKEFHLQRIRRAIEEESGMTNASATRSNVAGAGAVVALVAASPTQVPPINDKSYTGS